MKRLTRTEILGVYEAKIPLSSRAAFDFGNCVTLDPVSNSNTARGSGTESDPYRAEALKRVDVLEKTGECFFFLWKI